MSDGKDYEVGYGKPPTHTRFEKGRSGNPRGRPKGARNLETDLAEELGERIRIREAGRERPVSKQRAMIKALVAKALKGDTRAAMALFALAPKPEKTKVAADAEVGQTDLEILEEFLGQAVGRASKPPLGTDEEQKP